MAKKIVLGVLILFALIGLLFTAVFIGMQFGVFNVRGSIIERNTFFTDATTVGSRDNVCIPATATECAWQYTPEWETIREGLIKDIGVIARVSDETGVSRRMIAAVVIPEQVRFFTSEREVFKSYFEPLKILGSLSQFSLGVSGIKQETAEEIERHAQNPNSPFFPGEGMAALIAYPAGSNTSAALYERLTDPKNHYYSYLYTALYIKEVQTQWNAAGHDISKNPEAVVTLFNIGFENSKPHPSPQSGGAEVSLGGNTYSFGDLGAAFYRSNELVDILP